MYYDFTLQPQKIMFKMEVNEPIFASNKLKEKNNIPYYLP